MELKRSYSLDTEVEQSSEETKAIYVQLPNIPEMGSHFQLYCTRGLFDGEEVRLNETPRKECVA